MFSIDNATSAALAPTPPAAGTEGHFTNGSALSGTPATVVDDWWLEMVQAELRAVVVAAGITPSKTNNAQLLAALKNLFRIKLQANLALYVATTGNDTTGTGAVGAPFATLQKAWNVLQQSYDLNGYTAFINVANGTYAGVVCSGPVLGQGNGSVAFVGNIGSPSSVIISATNANCFTAQNGASVTVGGFQLTATGATSGGSMGYGIAALQGASISLNGAMIYGTLSQGGIIAAQGALVGVSAGYTISGSCPQHLASSGCGQVILGAVAVTISGSPAFSTSFANASNLGLIYAVGAVFSGGSPTGVRYIAATNSVINTGGGGASFFPGNSAGSTGTGGQYL